MLRSHDRQSALAEVLMLLTVVIYVLPGCSRLVPETDVGLILSPIHANGNIPTKYGLIWYSTSILGS